VPQKKIKDILQFIFDKLQNLNQRINYFSIPHKLVDDISNAIVDIEERTENLEK